MSYFTIGEVAADRHELIICHSALCGYPLLTSANNRTHGLQLADILHPSQPH